MWKFRDSREQYTVTVGTVFHGSKIPLHKWLMAIYLMGDSANGLNTSELQRWVELTYKSVMLLLTRITQE